MSCYVDLKKNNLQIKDHQKCNVNSKNKINTFLPLIYRCLPFALNLFEKFNAFNGVCLIIEGVGNVNLIYFYCLCSYECPSVQWFFFFGEFLTLINIWMSFILVNDWWWCEGSQNLFKVKIIIFNWSWIVVSLTPSFYYIVMQIFI